MVEAGQVIYGKLAADTERELAQKGLYRHATWGVVLPVGTDISGEQGRAIGEAYQKGQMQNLISTLYPRPIESIKTPLPPTQQQIQQMPQAARTLLEVKPVIVAGQITGFEDRRLGRSYSIQNIPQSRVQDLIDARLVSYAPKEQLMASGGKKPSEPSISSFAVYEEGLSPLHTKTKIYPADGDGIRKTVTITDIPRQVMTNRGEVYAEYPGGQRVLVAQGKKFFPEKDYSLTKEKEKVLSEQEYKQKIATALQEGKQVSYTKEGATITTEVQAKPSYGKISEGYDVTQTPAGVVARELGGWTKSILKGAYKEFSQPLYKQFGVQMRTAEQVQKENADPDVKLFSVATVAVAAPYFIPELTVPISGYFAGQGTRAIVRAIKEPTIETIPAAVLGGAMVLPFIGAVKGAVYPEGIRIETPKFETNMNLKITKYIPEYTDKEVLASLQRYEKSPMPTLIKIESAPPSEEIAKIYSKVSGVDFEGLPKIQKDFVVGQIEAKIRTQPEKFIPEIRRLTIERVKETQETKLSEIHQLALQRFMEREPITLYHGTTEASINKILKEGLKSSKETGKYMGIAKPSEFVYLTKDIGAAKGYAARAAVRTGGKPTVLEIRLPKEKVGEFGRLGETKVKSVPSEAIRLLKKEKPIKRIITAKDIFKEDDLTGKEVSSGKQNLLLRQEPQLEVKQAQKPVYKIDLKLSKNIMKEPEQYYASYPRMVGGSGLGESQYVKVSQMERLRYAQSQKQDLGLSQKQLQLLAEPQMIRQGYSFAQPQLQSQASAFRQEQRLAQQERQMLRQVQDITFAQPQLQSQRQMLRQEERLMFRTMQELNQLKRKRRVLLSQSQNKRQMNRLLGFDVYEILKGKPKAIARGVTREAGLDIGAREVLGNLRATFFLKKSDLEARDVLTGKEFSRYKSLFREPVARSRYRKYGEAYIQKQSKVGMFGGRLSFPGEKREIQSARMNKIMRSIA